MGEAYCIGTSNSTVGGGGGTSGPVAPGTITAGCTKYYTVIANDNCPLVESKNGITSAQFLKYNPEINAECTNLILGDSYCVASSNSTAAPTNLAAGSLSNCTSYATGTSLFLLSN